MGKNNFELEFEGLTSLSLRLDEEYLNLLEPLKCYLSTKKILPFQQRRNLFLRNINKKFDLNAKNLATFYSHSAGYGHTFNFHEKNRIQEAFDANDVQAFHDVLIKKKIPKDVIEKLINQFNPVSESFTLNVIESEIKEPSKLRIEKGERDIENEIIKALFSAFLWVSLPEKEMHEYFNPDFSKSEYQYSFWKQLQVHHPELFNRKDALHVFHITDELLKGNKSSSVLKVGYKNFLESAYSKINNHGFLVCVIEPLTNLSSWEVAADIILIAEKFREVPLDKNYFQWKKIQDITAKHIKEIELSNARFDLVNEGFTYRDTFVISGGANLIEKLVLIFQKNDRDETLIPCPSCRSNDVQGNSYSSLGVKSWECNNPLCPDRSKYNRGKRYSFRGLMMQEAIQGQDNLIPQPLVKSWMRDVVNNVTESEINEMLIRFYSMYGDTVHFHNSRPKEKSLFGRIIKSHKFILEYEGESIDGNHFFRRYVLETKKSASSPKNIGTSSFQVYHGDAAEILRGTEQLYDGAVTSPPYYNAREYSQWPNIYCYLHDMFDINREVFKHLKPGGIYLYNIFDYFDNENIIALSAMARKRMILSAYTVDLFRRIGFEVLGNIVWDKGDIEGKRGFNAGNFSPFYQSPFNCWEHVLVFRKPAKDYDPTTLRVIEKAKRIFSCKPVMKMFKGENTHGHTAPYPDALPELLIKEMGSDSFVLDPFAGSLTTGRVAAKYNIKSASLELSEEYCQLGLKMFRSKF